MKTIAIANNKGGCAKTTTTAHLGELLASMGVRTLLIDLDPQANLTERWTFNRPEFTIADVLGGAADPAGTLNDAVTMLRSPEGTTLHFGPEGTTLHLVPSEFNLANVAFGLLNDAVRGRTALRRELRNVAGGYDVALIDCPPEAGILLVNALFAADGVLLPAEPELDALSGVRRVVEMVDQIRTEYETTKPVVLGTLATRVDKRTNRHQDGIELMEASKLTQLWGIIPERNGATRDQDLNLAYRPVATRLERWLRGETDA